MKPESRTEPASERPGKTRNDRVADKRLPPQPTKRRSLQGILHDKEQWGLLPEKLQDAVRSSRDKEFPVEYRRVIAAYYKRIADFVVEGGTK